MAWITKNSATTQIPMRDEPYLTEETRARYEAEIVPRYEIRTGALLPILHDVQHCVGWLPPQALAEVAGFLGLTPAQVLDTASFYDEFHLKPVGRHIIGVCQSISCEVCGHMPILDHLSRKLGIEPGQTTRDGHITLRAMECLGACDTAPCALVDQDRYDNLTIADIDQIIDGLQASLAVHVHPQPAQI